MSGKLGWDSHNHPLYFSIFSEAFDLTGLEKEEALTRIKEENPSLVISWDNSKWGLTSSELETDFPVTVFNASFHGAVMNAVALRKYGVQADSSGLVANPDQVAKVIEQLVAGFSKEDFKRLLLEAQESYLRLGLYGTDDMGMRAPSLAPLQAVKELRDEGKLNLEINLFFRFSLLKKVATEAPDLLELCTGLKAMADGAFGVWTAAVCESYRDKSGNYGILRMSPDELEAQILQALELGVSTIAVHCIGDQGIETVLVAYQRLASQGKDTTGWRLEHAELISSHQARMAKSLGLVLSMQPNFSSDIRYRDRLGDRVKLLNPFRMLVDQAGFEPGKDLILGSDGIPTGLIEGLKWAINPPFESQRLTMEEAKRGYRVKSRG